MLSQRQAERIERDYRRGLAIKNIAATIGRGPNLVRQVLVNRGVRIRPRSAPAYEPTPQEIAQATAEIREKWTEEDREKRTVTKVEPWLPEVIDFSVRRNGKTFCEV